MRQSACLITQSISMFGRSIRFGALLFLAICGMAVPGNPAVANEDGQPASSDGRYNSWERGCIGGNICVARISQKLVDGSNTFDIGELGVAAIANRNDYYIFMSPVCDVPVPSQIRIDGVVSLNLHSKQDFPCTLLLAKLSEAERNAFILGNFLTYSIVDVFGRTREFRVDITNFPKDFFDKSKGYQPNKAFYVFLELMEKALIEEVHNMQPLR
jgi:hypothetical protein